MKRKYRFLIAGLVLLLLAGALVAYGLFTTHGSSLMARKLIDRWGGGYADATVGEITGNMMEGLRLTNLTLRNLKDFPPGSLLEIESLYINVSSLAIEGAAIEIENARLKLPSSGSIFLFGAMRKGILNFNVYSNNIDAKEVLRLFPKKPRSFRFVKGYLSNVDIDIRGTYKKPVLIGKFYVDKIFYKDFIVSKAPGKGNVRIERRLGKTNLFGPISFKKGEILAKNIHAQMEGSRVIFTGPPKNPVLDLYGYSMVEELKINIRVEGTRDRPKMELSSNPSFSETKLLLMLVTGKGWAGLDESLTQGTISPSLAKEAVDFFVLGGSGSRMANKLGIKDVSISFDEGKRGVALKTGLTKQIEVGYGVEQEEEETGGQAISTVTQKVGGEIKMTEKISVGVEREFRKHYDPQLSSPDSLPQETDDKLLLKYEGKF
jgi:autotransporter translocation and assembly factor TamB